MPISKLDRAKQFMPFSALKGYYELIKECEKIKEPRKELSDSEADILSSKLNEIKNGMIVTVTHYNKDFYEKNTGIVSDFNTTDKTLNIVKNKIKFENIIDIKICNESILI